MVRNSLLSLIIILGLALPVSQAQTPQVAIDRFVHDHMLDNVVVLTTEHEGNIQYGLGFIIGRSGRLIWIATAAHVVFPAYETKQPNLRLVPARVIRANRRGDSRSWSAAAPPDQGFGGDYAFVSFEMPFEEAGMDRWRERVAVYAPEIGETVVIAGRPSEIAYGDPGGRIVGRDADGAPIVEGLVGAPGQSGGPLVTPSGFVGMYVQSTGQRFIPLAVIQEGARQAGRPWGILEAEPTPLPVRLCVTARGRTESLRINGPLGIRIPDAQGCITTLSGQHQFTLNTMGTICSPSTVIISRNPNQRLEFVCSVDPNGIWISASEGSIEITQASSTTWSLRGLNQSRFGWLNGMLTGTLPKLNFSGRTGLGYQVSGTLTVEPLRIAGRLRVGSVPFDLEVTR